MAVMLAESPPIPGRALGQVPPRLQCRVSSVSLQPCWVTSGCALSGPLCARSAMLLPSDGRCGETLQALRRSQRGRLPYHRDRLPRATMIWDPVCPFPRSLRTRDGCWSMCYLPPHQSTQLPRRSPSNLPVGPRLLQEMLPCPQPLQVAARTDRSVSL